jgi:hypothetical protein
MPDCTHQEFGHPALPGDFGVGPCAPFGVGEHEGHSVAPIGVAAAVAVGLIGADRMKKGFPLATLVDFCSGRDHTGRRESVLNYPTQNTSRKNKCFRENRGVQGINGSKAVISIRNTYC